MPLFVHDPAAGATLPERLNLDGNPDLDRPWTNRTLQVVDDHGNAELVTTPLPPAEFAYGEIRFRKPFRPLAADAEGATPIADDVALPVAERAGQVPYIRAADDDLRLRKSAGAPPLVALVEDRQSYWQTLRFLAGRDQARVSQDYAARIAALTAEVTEARDAREQSLDDIAEAMAKLATAKDPAKVPLPAVVTAGGPAAPAAAAAPAKPAATAAPAAPAGDGKPPGAPIFLAEADLPRCTDCATCCQELPMLFERTTILVDGQAKQVSHLKAGALDGFAPGPDQLATIQRVIDTCDAEILR
jgi:pyruvate-ferredoxin/flavodoxin oxidoreductase